MRTALRTIGRTVEVLIGVIVLGFIGWGVVRLSDAHEQDQRAAERAKIDAVVRELVRPECIRGSINQ